MVKGSMVTQEGPKLSDLLEQHQHLHAVCSEGRQVPANKRRLPCAMVAASWEGDRLPIQIHSVFFKGVCAAGLSGSRVRICEFGPGQLTNPTPAKGSVAQGLLWTHRNDPS